ncbi:uncharacterized protein LOC133836817 [Drosophila sulfurigaster albostrigata]|uniref:uncharacterized protein LOC133836817 n=1 Tax=Drosophila sulfurigaster albostrigata TaxID=89887 RepID=UPI002D21E4B4|nr:uncharacterized protein LOC133836817 [Drosophila sulfurigaster albostrigata]
MLFYCVMNFVKISFGILLCFLYLCVKSNAKIKYDYEILDLEAISSDDNLFNVTSRIEYGELGKQTASLFVDWKCDTDEKTMIGMKVYFCRNGREDAFREMPYNIPDISFYQFLDHYYMKLFYPDYASCSNLPAFDKFVPPWNKTIYIINKCKPEGVSWPEVLPSGYYRIVIKLIAQAELVISISVKLTSRGLM